MKSFLLGLLILVILGAGVYFFIQQDGQPSSVPALNLPDNTQPEPTTSLTPAADPELVSELKAGGSSFRDPKGVYVFLYPADYKLETMNEGQHTRIFKVGPTQRGQTEMYDGVIVHFESVNLGGQTLDQWLDARIAADTANGTSTVEKAKEQIVINGYPGYTYTLRGLGSSQYLVLQKNLDSNDAVSITTLVADPSQQGFQKEVDAIISTLELIK